MALFSAAKKLGEGGQLEREVANLQKQQGELMEEATERQSALESLLTLWQRYSQITIISSCCYGTDWMTTLADAIKSGANRSKIK